MSPRFSSFARLLGLSALLMGLAVGCDGSTPNPNPPVETPRPDAERSTVEVSRAADVVDDGEDASTVTVTVRSTLGEPMKAQKVQLAVEGEPATLTPPEGLTDASGVFKSVLTAASPGTRTVKASVLATGGAVVLSTRPTVDFRAASAAKLAFTSVPGTSVAGTPVAPVLEVTVQDAKGRTVISATHEVTLALGAHPEGAVLEGTFSARAVKGVARFPEVVLKKAAPGYTLVASAAGLASATSAAFEVVPAAAASLTLALSAQQVTAGEKLSATVALADGFGNAATNYTGTVVLTSTDSTVAAVEHTFTAADAGQHTFQGLTFQRAGLVSLTAAEKVASPVLTATKDVSVLPGPARLLIVTAQPTRQSVRKPLGPVQATLMDAFFNKVAVSAPDVTVSLDTFFGASLSGTKTVTPVDGVATFTDLSVDTEQSGYYLRVSAPGIDHNITDTFEVVDDVLPAKPVLTAGIATKTSLLVEWRAVGDDGLLGTARAYALRISTTPIVTDADFEAASRGSTSSSGPQAPGSYEVGHFDNLTPGTTYYVALKVFDSANNSVRSDTLQVATLTPTPTKLVFEQAPVDGVAGTALATIRVGLHDADGRVDSATAPVTLTLTQDPSLTWTVNAVDGVATFSGVRIDKAGSNYTFEATSGALPAVTSTAFSIAHAPVSRFAVTREDGLATAGLAESFTVTALDAFDNVVTDYAGTVHCTSTDARAQLPEDSTFAGASRTFSVTFKGAGTQDVTVQDVGTASLNAVVRYEVSPAPAAGFVLNGPASVTAGQAFQLTVSVRDAFGNAATGYRGTVRFTTTSAQHVLPGDYAFTEDDQGQKTFLTPELRSAGAHEVQVQDTVDAALVATHALSVSPDVAARLVLSGGAGPYDAGTPFSLEVVARDAFGNEATGYLGTIHFSSTDGKATLPADSAFTPDDKGRRAFSGLVLNTGGRQVITAVDTLASTVTGSFEVEVLAPTSLGLTVAAGPQTSGQKFTVEVAALTDAMTVSPNYTGTVRFTSSDDQATLPLDYTFTDADKGQRSFEVTFQKAGTQTLTVRDLADASLTQTVSIDVSPGAPAKLAFFVEPTSGEVRTGLSAVGVVLQDAAGNKTTATSPEVQLTLKGGNSAATLSGNTRAMPMNGEAYFGGLSVDEEGTGFQLTASAEGLPPQDSALFTITDTTPPRQAPLAVTTTGVSRVTLAWSATGDDDLQGTAAAYELRYATSAITTDAEFDAATAVATGAPQAPGGFESLEVTGLNPGTTYHFALKVRDGAGNRSSLTSASTTTVDPCAGFTCEPSTKEPACAADGISRVTYANVCVVRNEAPMCEEQLTTTACTGANAVCFAGTCDTAAKPAAGELFVTEVMHSPSNGTTEYIELTNPTQKLLNLNGLAVTFTEGSVSRSVSVDVGAGNALVIGKGGTLVLAQVKDQATNGGVQAEYGYGGDFTLGSVGQLTLASGATTVESLAYDLAFPQTPGRAMNLAAAVSGTAANKHPWYWCDSTIPLAGGDHGTPNAPNEECGMVVEAPVNYCRIQHPKTIPSVDIGESVTVYTQFWEPSVTDRKKGSNDFYPHVIAEFGFGTDAANPASWTWKQARFNPFFDAGFGDDDELYLDHTFTRGGSYVYGFRYRMVDPTTGTVSADVYCDQNGVAVDFATAVWGTATVVVPPIVISEISGRGGDASSSTNIEDDFIELYNPTDKPVNLEGWKVQYKSPTNTVWNTSNVVTIPAGKVIPARGYFLIAHTRYTGGTTVPADVTSGAINMGGTSGSLRLGLPGIGTALDDPLAVDKLAYGSGAVGGEATSVATTSTSPPVGGSIERKARSTSTSASMAVGGTDEVAGNGFDSGDNATDFVIRTTRQPQNASSPTELP